MHFEVSGLIVCDPVHRRGLTLSIRPDRSRGLAIWKCCTGTIERKAKNYLSALHGPVILIQHFNDKGSHNVAFQIVRLSFAGQRNDLQTLRRHWRGRGWSRRRTWSLGWLSLRRERTWGLLLRQNGHRWEENYQDPG